MASLLSIQKGSVDAPNGSNTSTTVTLGTALSDTSKAFLMFTLHTPETGTTWYAWCTGTITDTTTLTFQRNITTGYTGTATIYWYVVEFSSGVLAQRGEGVPGATTVNQTISTITVNKSFASGIGIRPSGTPTRGMARVRLTSTTNLEITTSNVSSVRHSWEVVEYDNCTTQMIDKTVNTASSTSTISSVTTNKSFSVSSTSGSGTSSNDYPSIVLTDSTTLTYTKVGVLGLNFTTYVVDITDSVVAQQGTLSFSSTDTSLTATITSSSTTNSFLVGCGGNLYCQGSSAATSEGGSMSFGIYQTDATTVTVQRGVANSATSTPGWQIITFGDGTPSTNYGFPLSFGNKFMNSYALAA